MRFQAVIAAALALSACKGKHADRKKQEPTAPAPVAQGGSADQPEMRAPEVHGPGTEPVGALSAKVRYGASALSVNGGPICEVAADGGLADDCYDRAIHVLETTVRSDDPIGLELNASLTFLRVGTLINKLETAGFHSFALLIGDGKTMIPISTPDPKVQSGLRLAVTVNSGSVDLWSLSGEEGTKAKPKLQQPLASGLAPLTSALAEIVHRRWPSGQRPPEDHSIILQVDRMQTVEVMLRVIAAVRASDKGELFPAIVLMGGV